MPVITKTRLAVGHRRGRRHVVLADARVRRRRAAASRAPRPSRGRRPQLDGVAVGHVQEDAVAPDDGRGRRCGPGAAASRPRSRYAVHRTGRPVSGLLPFAGGAPPLRPVLGPRGRRGQRHRERSARPGGQALDTSSLLRPRGLTSYHRVPGARASVEWSSPCGSSIPASFASSPSPSSRCRRRSMRRPTPPSPHGHRAGRVGRRSSPGAQVDRPPPRDRPQPRGHRRLRTARFVLAGLPVGAYEIRAELGASAAGPAARRRPGGRRVLACSTRPSSSGAPAEEVTVTADAAADPDALRRAELPRLRGHDPRPAAERPQLHRPGASCSRGWSPTRTATAARSWPTAWRCQHQRPGPALERVPARRHAA